MNVSFTSRHGEEILTKAHKASAIATKLEQQGTPVSDTDSLTIQAKLLDSLVGADILTKSAPIEDDSAYAHGELTEKAAANVGNISDSNLVSQLKTALTELTAKISDAVSKHKDSLDGEDKTVAAMVGGTIKNIQSKMYG